MSPDVIDQSFYKRKLDPTKTNAEKEVRQALSDLTAQITAAVTTLKEVEQTPSLNIQTIERRLTIARDDWLSSMKAVFDDAIFHVKDTLTRL
jgi:hypothetical protein